MDSQIRNTGAMIDTHAHVAFEQFDEDREDVIARAREAGVQWIEVGTDIEQSRKALELAEQFPEDVVGASVGVHPSDVLSLQESDWETIRQLLSEEAVCAVGEVGLDYYRGGSKEEQLPVLERFAALAIERDLPVIFHVRNGESADAHDDLLAYLQSLSGSERPRGVMHTYSGTREQAESYLELGMHLSFSGVVTFKNAGEIPDVASSAPLDRILIETDCPFLAPEPYRGKRNEPAYVRYVAEKIAALRDISVEKLITQTARNTQELFQRT